ncbi:hypothetical protein SGRIM128S_05739 [Streptomyces griseomycini]
MRCRLAHHDAGSLPVLGESGQYRSEGGGFLGDDHRAVLQRRP